MDLFRRYRGKNKTDQSASAAAATSDRQGLASAEYEDYVPQDKNMFKKKVDITQQMSCSDFINIKR